MRLLAIENRTYRGAIEVFGNARNTLDDRERAAARGLSARRGAERAQPDHLRPDRSAQGPGRGRPNLRAAEPGTVQERGLRHLRDRRVSGVSRRGHRRSLWRARPSRARAAWSRPTTASRSMRSTRPRAGAGPRTRKTSSMRRCRISCRPVASTSTRSPCRSPRRDRFRIGRRPCSRSRASRTFATRSASWACRTEASRRPPIRRHWRRLSDRRSTRRSPRRPTCRSSPNRGSCRRPDRCPPEELLFRLIDKKGAFEWQQGVLTSWDGQTMTLLVNGQPKAVRARRGRADLPAHRRRASRDATGLVDRRRADRLSRRGRHDPDAGVPDQLRQSRGRSLFATGHLAGAQDAAGARRGVSGRSTLATSPTCASSSEGRRSVR